MITITDIELYDEESGETKVIVYKAKIVVPNKKRLEDLRNKFYKIFNKDDGKTYVFMRYISDE